MEDLQHPKRVRIEVSKDHEDENDRHTLNNTMGPQPPKEQTDIEVEARVKGQEEVGVGVEVERREEVELMTVKERKDNRLTKTRQLGRSRHAPARDDNSQFTKTL